MFLIFVQSGEAEDWEEGRVQAAELPEVTQTLGGSTGMEGYCIHLAPLNSTQ